LDEKLIIMANRIFFGELKLIRPISFRLPDPEYRSLMDEKGDGKLSELLRDIVAQHTSKRNVRQELPLHVNSKTKK